MQEVAELVEQRHDVVVLHEAAREVADQDPFGDLDAPDPGDEVELGGVVVLARPRVQVEVDPTQPRAVARPSGTAHHVAHHVVRRDVLVPDRGVGHLDVLQAEQPAGDLEQTGPDLVEGEVAPHLLGVDVKALPSQDLGVVGLVHVGDRGRVRPVLTDPLQQEVVVAPGRPGGQLGDAVDEGRDRWPRADHLDLGVVRRPVGVAECRGELTADLEKLVQDRVVGRPGPVLECRKQFRSQLPVVGEGPHRHEVGVLRGQDDQAVLTRGVRPEEVLRQPDQPGRVDPDRAHVVADAAAERLGEGGLALRQLSHPRAGLLVAVDGGPPEVAKDPLEQSGGARVEPGPVECRERVEDRTVLRDLDLQPVGLLLQPLGLLAHRLVRMDVGVERAQRGDAAQRRLEPVPGGEDLPCRGGVACSELGEPLAHLRQPVRATAGQPRQRELCVGQDERLDERLAGQAVFRFFGGWATRGTNVGLTLSRTTSALTTTFAMSSREGTSYIT